MQTLESIFRLTAKGDKVSFMTLSAILSKIDKNITQSEVLEVLDSFDITKKGYLDFDDFKKVCLDREWDEIIANGLK